MTSSHREASKDHSTASDDGALESFICAHDWSHSALGPPELWSDSLRTWLSISLGNAFPTMIVWQDDLLLYNDSFAQMLGMNRRVHVLGTPVQLAMPDLWLAIGSIVRQVRHQAISARTDAVQLLIERDAVRTQAFFSFSLTPIDTGGNARGVLCFALETTQSVVAQRQARLLHKLAQASPETVIESPTAAERRCMAVLQSDPDDIAFALLYRFEGDGHAVLAATTHGQEATAWAPFELDPASDLWPLQAAARGEPFHLHSAMQLPAGLPAVSEAAAVRECWVLPIGRQAAQWALILGVNPFAAPHTGVPPFFQDVADALTAALTHAAQNATRREREIEHARCYSMISSTTVGFAQCDEQGTLNYVNDRQCEITGRSREQLLSGTQMHDLIHPEDLPATLALHRRLFETGQSFVTEFRYMRADGKVVWVLANITAILGPAGNVIGSTAACVDLSTRKQAEDVLRSCEERLRLGLEAGRMGTWSWNPITDTTWADARCMEILGADIQGPRMKLARNLQETDHGRLREALLHALHPDRDGSFDVELRWERRDGKAVWLQVSGQTRFELRNAVRTPVLVSGILIDTTRRKEADELQSLLMHEVDHRAKNMLATIQAMISLSAHSHTDVREFVASIKRRIGSLANAHSLLAVTRWEGASLRKLMESELSPYQFADIGSVTIGGNDLLLKPSIATALSMIIHELTTNAAKYGALSQPGGHVDISWEIVAEGSLQIGWKESGGPVVSPPTKQGFGSLLIARSLTAGIGGNVRLSFDPAGVSCIIRIPGSQLLSSDAKSTAGYEAAAPEHQSTDRRPGQRILVVEDQLMIYMEMARLIESLGHEMVGSAETLEDTIHLARTEQLDAAILDIHVGDEEIYAAAEILEERGIPFMFMTAYGSTALHPRYRTHNVLSRPVRADELQALLQPS